MLPMSWLISTACIRSERAMAGHSEPSCGNWRIRPGIPSTFSVVSRERMIQASIAGNESGDPSMMRRLFVEISDPVRVAALRKAIASLDQHGFAWNDRYIATAEPGHKVDVRLAGTAGDQFMARTQTSILIGKTSDLPKPRPEQGREFALLPTSWGDDRRSRER